MSVATGGATLPGMRLLAVFVIFALWLVPSDAAIAGPATPRAPSAPAAPVGGYRWPLAGSPMVTRPFEPPPEPWLAGHRGIDLAGSPGEAVLAGGSGIVAFAGSVAGVGVVSIDHPDGLRTTYEPVTPAVPVGARITAGQPIGVLVAGHPGCPVSACLHWGLRRGTDYLDPLLLLRAARTRLYPLSSLGSSAASRSYSSTRL